MFNHKNQKIMNHIYSFGKLTIKCYVYAERNEAGEIVRHHGTTHVATVTGVYQGDINRFLNEEIEKYLSRCKFKNCKRTFSWKFETD